MKAEFILDARELLHMPLLIAFNCFLAEGFPEALSTKVAHVFFKRDNSWAYPSKVVHYDP
jgi:hypothetical protein